LVTPNFIEKFIPRDHALGVLYKELQSLKFLSSNCDSLAAASDLGFGKIYCYVRKDVLTISALCPNPLTFGQLRNAIEEAGAAQRQEALTQAV
jgi:hypothetical protein